MDVGAEGVETDSQLAKLKNMMCDEMQEFLLGKPMTSDAFGELLQRALPHDKRMPKIRTVASQPRQSLG
jgi:EAL domain-containing protein (putative c-di-GMP-specific phosphodiesterase class I)